MILDDRNESAGVKFNDADLIGLPVRLVVSRRNIRQGVVELKLRTEAEPETVARADIADRVAELLGRTLVQIQLFHSIEARRRGGNHVRPEPVEGQFFANADSSKIVFFDQDPSFRNPLQDLLGEAI